MTGFRTARINLGAVSSNVAALRAQTGGGSVVAVVKADGYGHGASMVARAAIAGGAEWLGTADLAEAVALRSAGITAPVLCWLHGPGTDFNEAAGRGIEVAVSSIEQLNRAAATGAAMRVQVKVETGLGRNGASPDELGALLERAAVLEARRSIRVTGMMTHLSNTSPEDDLAALRRFDDAVAAARSIGLEPQMLHAAATAAAIDIPESRLDAVRIGLGLYGLSPFDDRSSADLGLTPAMRLSAPVAAVRRVPAGQGVSYGYTHRTEAPTTLALIPLGYADGIPRQASGRGVVAIGGREFPQRGRIAMDQCVVEVGDADVKVGDEAVVFGDPARGEPAVERWADAADTINYDIVTRIGGRVARSYRGGQ